MAKKIVLLVILIALFGVTSHAGENQDKRKAKRQARRAEQQAAEQEFRQAKQRDFRAEDALYREIQDQEHSLRRLRRKLFEMHEDNVRKYGQEQNFSQERQNYIHRYTEYDDYER